MPDKVWDNITYLLPIFNSTAIDIWEWISNFIPHFVKDRIIYWCWDLSLTMLIKGARGIRAQWQWGNPDMHG